MNQEAVCTKDANGERTFDEGKACHQSCRLHWPLRIASGIVIALLLAIYSLVLFF